MHSVLYVDDEPDLLEIGKIFLERSQEFSLDTKTSAQDALQALELNHYDAIVSDYQMPEMNGIAFLKEVRSTYGNIPFIIFTGKGREEVVIEALNNGADFYLQKGGEPETLYSELMHVIRRSILMQETRLSFAEQEQRYHDIQNANDLIQSVAPDGHFLFVNKKWLDTLGYQERELTNVTIFDIIHDESLDHCKRLFSRVISGENVGIIDAIFKTRDGKKVFVEGMANCKIKEGQPQYTRGIFKDVTDRKLTEAALGESEEKFRTIFENSPYPISINSIPDGKFIAVNDAFLKSSGYSEPEVLGKTPIDLGMISLIDFGRLVSRVAVSGKIENVPMALTGKGGIRVHVQFSSIPVTINNRPAIMTMTAEITKLKRVEEELLQKNQEIRASEEIFRNVFENSPLGMTLTLPDLRFLLVNPAWVSMMGYTEEEFRKMTFKDITHPDHLEGDIEAIRALEAGTIPVYSTEKRYIRKDGSTLWGALKVTAIRNQDDTLRHYLAQIEDITQRKKAEELVRESEKKFATIFQSSPVALTLVSAINGTFVDVNDAFVRNTGYSRDEVIGTTSEALGIFTDSDERERLVSALRDQRTVHDIEIRCRIKTGEIRTCLFSSRIVLIGEKPHIFSTIRDISERKKTEDALQESEEKFRLISESSPDHIIIQDKDLRYTYVLNPQLGMSLEDMIGKTDYDLLSKEDADKLTSIKRKVLGTGKAFPYETSLVSWRRETEYFEGVYLPKYDQDGEIDGLMGYFRNTTDRKKAEEALRESEEKIALVMNGVPTHIAYMDTDLRFVYLNKAHAEWFGLSEEELIGKRLDEVLPEDVFLRALSYYQQVLSGRDVIFENPTRDRDGRSRVLVIHLVPHIHGERVVGFFAALDDITERKNTEAAFQAMIRSMVGTTGLNALHKITASISSWLGADCVSWRGRSSPTTKL